MKSYQLPLRATYVAVLLFLVSLPSFGQTETVSLENTQSFGLHSNEVDEDYEIFVSLPFGYDRSQATFKTLYVLDANVTFGMVRDIQTLISFEPENPPLIVVGIAYQNLNEWIQKRSRDYKPKEADAENVRKFASFLQKELIPEIGERYRTNGKRLIYGHSTAGLYGLYTMMTLPDQFDGYIMTSPSVDEDNGITLDKVKNPEVKFSRPVRLYISIGSKEKASFQAAYIELVKSISNGTFDNLTFESETIDATHMASMAPAFIKGLQFVNKVK